MEGIDTFKEELLSITESMLYLIFDDFVEAYLLTHLKPLVAAKKMGNPKVTPSKSNTYLARRIRALTKAVYPLNSKSNLHLLDLF